MYFFGLLWKSTTKSKLTKANYVCCGSSEKIYWPFWVWFFLDLTMKILVVQLDLELSWWFVSTGRSTKKRRTFQLREQFIKVGGCNHNKKAASRWWEVFLISVSFCYRRTTGFRLWFSLKVFLVFEDFGPFSEL